MMEDNQQLSAAADGAWRVLEKVPLEYSLAVADAQRVQIHFCLRLQNPLSERQVVCTFEVTDGAGADVTAPNLPKSDILNKHFMYLRPGLKDLEVEQVVYELPPRAALLKIGLLEWLPQSPVKAPSYLPAVLESSIPSRDAGFAPIRFLRVAT